MQEIHNDYFSYKSDAGCKREKSWNRACPKIVFECVRHLDKRDLWFLFSVWEALGLCCGIHLSMSD